MDWDDGFEWELDSLLGSMSDDEFEEFVRLLMEDGQGVHLPDDYE